MTFWISSVLGTSQYIWYDSTMGRAAVTVVWKWYTHCILAVGDSLWCELRPRDSASSSARTQSHTILIWVKITGAPELVHKTTNYCKLDYSKKLLNKLFPQIYYIFRKFEDIISAISERKFTHNTDVLQWRFYPHQMN